MTVQIGPKWIGRIIAGWMLTAFCPGWNADYGWNPMFGPNPNDDYPASRPPMTALPPTAADLAEPATDAGQPQPATNTGIDAIDHYETSPGPHGHRRIRAIYSDGTPGPWV